MTSHTFILATVQNNSGVSVAYAVPNAHRGSCAIFLNKAVPPGKTAKVAWFVVN